MWAFFGEYPLVSCNGAGKVYDCKVWKNGTMSDHSAILLKISLTSLKAKTPDSLSTGIIDWHKIHYDDTTNKAFNDLLREKLQDNSDYTFFNKQIIKAGYATATTFEKFLIGWFENDSVNLQPRIDTKTHLLNQYRNEHNPIVREDIKLDLKAASKLVKDRVEITKNLWATKISSNINEFNLDPKKAWDAAYQLRDGVKGHHKKPISKKFRNKDGILARTKKENIQTVENHFTEVFNTIHPTDPDATQYIKQRETMEELDIPPTWNEFKQAVTKLKNDKKPGMNGVMPDAFKALDNKNLSILFNFMIKFWAGEADFEEWHTGIGSMLPKKGDLSDLNKWRCINLMDVASKILSCILTERAYKLLEKNDVHTQFGATRKVGCQDANFCLKTLLHL